MAPPCFHSWRLRVHSLCYSWNYLWEMVFSPSKAVPTALRWNLPATMPSPRPVWYRPICFSNHFWCIFIHYPLTTKTILHFLKLIYSFITSDTPHALLSQWISSALLWLFPSSLARRGHPSHLFRVRLASLCFQTTFWSSQHSPIVNYVCICISIPCPTTQTSGWHASHLLHHNTNVVSRIFGIQKVPSKYLFK